MDNEKRRKAEPRTVEEKWWHYAIVGVVLTAVAVVIVGAEFVDVSGRAPLLSVSDEWSPPEGVSVIEASAPGRSR